MIADDRLLELLAVALAPEPRQAPPAAVEQVRALARSGTEADPALASLHRRRPRVVTWAAAAAVAAATFLAGLVVTDDLPRPVRSAAHAIGLPVDSNELVDARDALDRLGRALAAGDADAIRTEDVVMVRLVKGLDADERARIEPVAHEVHLRAVQFLGDQ